MAFVSCRRKLIIAGLNVRRKVSSSHSIHWNNYFAEILILLDILMGLENLVQRKRFRLRGGYWIRALRKRSLSAPGETFKFR